MIAKSVVVIFAFQSTRPSRDGTWREVDMDDYTGFQSTRPSRDGTNEIIVAKANGEISIHPPLAGRDEDQVMHLVSTFDISIHPPLAGRDPRSRLLICSQESYFNPPAPRGTGHGISIDSIELLIFQSTRPSRDGTES